MMLLAPSGRCGCVARAGSWFSALRWLALAPLLLAGGTACLAGDSGTFAVQDASNPAAAQSDSEPADSTSTGTATSAPLAGSGTAALSNGATAGGNTPTTPAQPAQVADTNTILDANYPYALVGRFDVTDVNRIRFNLPGSKIGVAFSGPSLSIQLAGTGADTFDVNIDGVDYASPGSAFTVDPGATPVPCQPVAQVPAYDGTSYPGCILAVPSSNMNTPITYPIVTGLSAGQHVAWITKRSEFLQGTAQGSAGTNVLYGFTLAQRGGTLLPAPAYLKRRLEFAGDSSTTGYGAAQPNPCGYSTRNSDAGRALVANTGLYLKAETVNLSSSGQGVYQSYYDHSTSHNLPPLYNQLLGMDLALASLGIDATQPYDFTRDHVDAVILVAGGDDLWGASGSGYFSNNDASNTTSARTNFVNAYVNWLGTIRSKRPDATIFAALTYGASGNDIVTLGSALQDAVAARNKAGDSNVLYFTFFPQGDSARNPKGYQNLGDLTNDQKLGMGCNGHITPVIARILAQNLGSVVAARLGWTDAGY